MVIIIKKLKKTFFIVLLVLTYQNTYALSDEDYLKQLELEVGAEIDDMPAVLNTNGSSHYSIDAPESEAELILDKKKLIVDLDTFDAALKEAYPESYALYEQLNDKQKRAIYQGFREHKRLYNSSVKVISVYLSSH